MITVDSKIQEIKNKGYELDFGQVFEFAFENYKKIALYAGLILIVFFVLISVFVGIAISAAISNNYLDVEQFTNLKNFNPDKLPINFMVLYYSGLLLLTSLLSPFQAGFLKMADCAQKGEEFHVSTIFDYYKSPYFKEIFITSFIITLAGMVFSVFLNLAGFKFVGLLISFGISFFTFLSIPLIIFANFRATEAINASIHIVAKKPLLLLLLLIVGGILSLTGLIALCIGIFFTYPFIFSINYSIYNSIIGFEINSKINSKF